MIFKPGDKVKARNFRINSLIPPEEIVEVKSTMSENIRIIPLGPENNWLFSEARTEPGQKLECLAVNGFRFWCSSFEVKSA